GGKRSLPPVRRPRKGSHDVLLQHLAAGGDPVEAERRQVKCAIASTDDKLGDAAADRWRLLQAMAGKSGGEIKARHIGDGAEDGVMVEEVHVVVPGPGTTRPDHLEGWNAMREHRPDRLLEEVVIDREVVAVRV